MTSNAPGGLSPNEQAGHYIELWKQTVSVQQHFNDIEWRIRGLALTAATFAIGAAAVAAKDRQSFAATAVLLIGLLLWYAFYFVDRYWYHPLLKAAVEQGELIEAELTKLLPEAGLTTHITAGSAVPRPLVIRILSLGRHSNDAMHSGDKLAWFYRLGAAALITAAITLGLYSLTAPQPTSPSTVKLEQQKTDDNGPSPTPQSETTSPATPAPLPGSSP